MSTTIPTVRPKWTFSLADFVANRIVADPVLREDAGRAHRFVKRPGSILVELNPVRDKELSTRFAAIKKARDEKVGSADSVREQKLKDMHARHAAELAAIEDEYRNVEVTATNEFNAAEQALLAEFSVPPQANLDMSKAAVS